MRLIVLSDSHGHTAHLKEALLHAGTEAPLDGILFAGDGLEDLLPYRSAFPLVRLVHGNCDSSSHPEYSLETLFQVGGHSIFLTHGHRYQVKISTQSLYYRALETGASLAVFGHTHRPVLKWQGNVLLLNPGALMNRCYATLSIREDGTLTPQLCTLP